MRSFPRTHRRLAAAAVLSALALSGLAAPHSGDPAWAHDDDLEQRQRDVEKKIDDAHHDLDDSSQWLRRTTVALREAQRKLAGARAELAEARRRLAAAELRDRQMRAALAKAERTLETAEAEVEEGRANAEEQQEQVEALVVQAYEQGDPDLLAVEGLMNAETAQDLLLGDIAQEAMIGDQAMTYDELRAALVLLEVREAEVERARNDVARKREEAAEHLEVVTGIKAEAQSARDQVVSLVDRRASVQAKADRARARDQRVLERLQAREDRIQEKIRQRQLAELRRLRERKSSKAARTPTGGALLTPVAGAYVTSPFGYRTHPIYGYWGLHDGVDFGTGGCGAPMRATSSGRVSQKYWSDVYGNRLYLDNGIRRGVGLTSVYNHASGYTVGVGDYVEAGQTIGYVGQTGWSTACHLHFTVLANGRPVAPYNWF